MLKKRKAVITGCSRGIGAATLECFVKNGADVCACFRNETDNYLKTCKEYSEKYGVKVYPVFFDASNREEMREAVKEIKKCMGTVDILVNNIGTVDNINAFSMTKMEDIKKEFEVNFFSQIEFTQLLSRLMIKRGSFEEEMSSIINISAVAGIDGKWGSLQYVSAKSAMLGATKRMATEFGELGIRVNSVAPGLTETDMALKMQEKLKEELYSTLIIKRMAKPNEIANVICFLASNMSSYITGQVIRVDGGITN